MNDVLLFYSSSVQIHIYNTYVIHRTIYNMCTQKPPYDYSHELYERYKGIFKVYNEQTVRLLILSSLYLIRSTCMVFVWA